jgi:BirA family biotin operon repressor/biotin-[acetyl-CoA-carboxylase] ligase
LLNISSIKDEIISKTFIEEVLYFDHITSTNDYAKKLNGKDNVLIITGNQLKGRGRFDRVWESEPYKNLIFSIKKKIEIQSNKLYSVNFFFSYFLIDSIIQFLLSSGFTDNGNQFSIKWPNDLIYLKKKFCGILIENIFNKNEFIIGIGINVNQTEFSLAYDEQSTSLKKITGKELNLNELLKFILIYISNNLRLLFQNEDNIYELWKKKCNMIGKTIKYKDLNQKEFEAQVIDINKDGSIKLNLGGKIQNYYSGDIKIITNRMPN